MAEEKTRFQAHAEEQKRKQKEQEQRELARQRLEAKARAAADTIARTQAGADFLVWVFHLCGYNRSSIVVHKQTGDVLPAATAHNEARRSVYVDIREKLTPELRAKIEQFAESSPSEEEK